MPFTTWTTGTTGTTCRYCSFPLQYRRSFTGYALITHRITVTDNILLILSYRGRFHTQSMPGAVENVSESGKELSTFPAEKSLNKSSKVPCSATRQPNHVFKTRLPDLIYKAQQPTPLNKKNIYAREQHVRFTA